MPKALGLVLSTVDSSFGDYTKNTPEARDANDNNQIDVIVQHLKTWYAKKMGSTADQN